MQLEGRKIELELLEIDANVGILSRKSLQLIISKPPSAGLEAVFLNMSDATTE